MVQDCLIMPWPVQARAPSRNHHDSTPAKPSHQLAGPILKHASSQSSVTILLPCPTSECHHISDHVVGKIHGKKRSHGSSPYLKHFCRFLHYFGPVGKLATLQWWSTLSQINLLLADHPKSLQNGACMLRLSQAVA